MKQMLIYMRDVLEQIKKNQKYSSRRKLLWRARFIYLRVVTLPGLAQRAIEPSSMDRQGFNQGLGH